jgi:EAL domain-containing protein (putative c-di-GMP-specific phosphodiesterase class I)
MILFSHRISLAQICRTVTPRLADANITIAIDDFGTGYSSLQYLHQLPISFIKIDQSFVRRLNADKGAVHIVEAAVTLAHKMGMKAVAEGVEDKEVYNLLRNLRCDIAQGFMISRPLPAGDFAKWYMQRENSSCYGQVRRG